MAARLACHCQIIPTHFQELFSYEVMYISTQMNYHLKEEMFIAKFKSFFYIPMDFLVIFLFKNNQNALPSGSLEFSRDLQFWKVSRQFQSALNISVKFH